MICPVLARAPCPARGGPGLAENGVVSCTGLPLPCPVSRLASGVASFAALPAPAPAPAPVLSRRLVRGGSPGGGARGQTAAALVALVGRCWGMAAAWPPERVRGCCACRGPAGSAVSGLASVCATVLKRLVFCRASAIQGAGAILSRSRQGCMAVAVDTGGGIVLKPGAGMEGGCLRPTRARRPRPPS